MAKSFAVLGNAVVGAAVSRALEAAGLQRVDEPGKADAVFTYFIHSGALEDAYFDTGGLVKAARKDTLLVDLSPSTPSFARELSAVATVNDLRFVEAPLVVRYPSEADAFARENLECFLAGDDDAALDEAEGLLAGFAAAIERVGSCGMAQMAKCACTSQIAGQVLSAVESTAIYESSDAVAHDFVLPACSPVTGQMLAAVSQNAFEGDYTVEMFMGDVVAAMTAADDAGLILPQLEATLHLLEVIAVIGGADMSPAALALLYRDEKASAEVGLDWTRAEGLFAGEGHDHHHDHEGLHDYDDADDYDGYDDDDPFGFTGGFGAYSAN